MRRSIIWLFLLYLTAGCDMPSPAAKGVDPEFEEVLAEYQREKAQRTGEGVRAVAAVMVPDLEGNTVGQCRRWSNGDREIFIDQEFWNFATNSLREQLFFHEMGHCDLDLEHVQGLAIMSPSLIQDTFYRDNRETLIDDMMFGESSFDTVRQKLLDHNHDACIIEMD